MIETGSRGGARSGGRRRRACAGEYPPREARGDPQSPGARSGISHAADREPLECPRGAATSQGRRRLEAASHPPHAMFASSTQRPRRGPARRHRAGGPGAGVRRQRALGAHGHQAAPAPQNRVREPRGGVGRHDHARAGELAAVEPIAEVGHAAAGSASPYSAAQSATRRDPRPRGSRAAPADHDPRRSPGAPPRARSGDGPPAARAPRAGESPPEADRQGARRANPASSAAVRAEGRSEISTRAMSNQRRSRRGRDPRSTHGPSRRRGRWFDPPPSRSGLLSGRRDAGSARVIDRRTGGPRSRRAPEVAPSASTWDTPGPAGTASLPWRPRVCERPARQSMSSWWGGPAFLSSLSRNSVVPSRLRSWSSNRSAHAGSSSAGTQSA